MDIARRLMEQGFWQDGRAKGFSMNSWSVQMWVEGLSATRRQIDIWHALEAIEPATALPPASRDWDSIKRFLGVVEQAGRLWVDVPLSEEHATDVWVSGNHPSQIQSVSETWRRRGYRVKLLQENEFPAYGLVVMAEDSATLQFSGQLPSHPQAMQRVDGWH